MADPASASASRAIALADAVHDAVMEGSPVEASLLGDHRFDAALPDPSPSARAAARRRLAALDAQLAQLDDVALPDDAARSDEAALPGDAALSDEAARSDGAALSADDRVTVAVARHVVSQARHELDDRYAWTAAGPIASGAVLGSAAAALLAALPKLVLATAAQGADHLRRCAGVPGLLDASAGQLRAGVDNGCTPPARLVAATVAQLDRYLRTAPSEDPLHLPAPPDSPRWDARMSEVLDGTVRPAIGRHRDLLADVILPAARPDATPGLCWLPGGDRLYRDAVAVHTTTAVTEEALHRTGRSLLAELDEEYAELGAQVLDTADPAAVRARLRDDPRLRFATAAQIRAAAESALDRATRAMGEWFGVLPDLPCEVRPIPALEAPESTIAYYQPPAIDGARPGIYHVNTSEPHLRPRYEAEALAFHESVPGHHTQIATAMRRPLPTLRRVVYLTAYAEGWALYVERLADEMGLYTDDLARLGMVAFDSWRACRLVVDTGIHADGWSRQQAIDFMLAHSPLSPRNIANEVDRYIGWPGQALAYMTGRQRIVDLRRRARAALGARFDVRAFHRVVLDHGAVPLDTLGRLVEDWLRREGVAGQPSA